ncbi:MAG TPA: riboflavin synthase [bacterium]|nr:riboflavin synthase [bacterium]
MFTGLIQEMGRVLRVQRTPDLLTLTLEAPKTAPALKVGDSLAVNGCCLTVVEVATPRLVFQLVPETLQRTALGGLKEGDRVNLEPPLTASAALGGHFVQGHVDGVGTLTKLEPFEGGARLGIRLPKGFARYVVEKGSIALDGVSLTVAAVKGDEVEVALIPHTLKETVFQFRKAGDGVQVEVDLLAKYVERLTGAYGPAGGKA